MRKPDPRPKRNGTCAVCGKPRPDIAVAHHDPFCTSTCARAFHGCSLQLTGQKAVGF